MPVYWSKLAQQIFIMFTICMVIYFGLRYGARPSEVVAAVAPLLAVLALQLPAVPNFTTTFKTMRPPPPPPPPLFTGIDVVPHKDAEPEKTEAPKETT